MIALGNVIHILVIMGNITKEETHSKMFER